MENKKAEIMGFKKFIKHYLLRESVKEMELNRILDKVYKKQELEEREIKFLDLYNSTSEEDMKDYMYLSKNTAFNRVKSLLNSGKTVICDLYDRDGKIGMKIKDISNNFENEICTITFKNGEKYNLSDKFLYNIVFINKKNEYSLQSQDEYFEKIPISR
jgi:hypothetical protein